MCSWLISFSLFLFCFRPFLFFKNLIKTRNIFFFFVLFCLSAPQSGQVESLIVREPSNPCAIWDNYAGILNMVMCSHTLVLLLISLKYQLNISAILPFLTLGNSGKTGLSELPLHISLSIYIDIINLCSRALVSCYYSKPCLCICRCYTIKKIVPRSLHLVNVAQVQLSRCLSQSAVKEPDEDVS